MSQDSDSNSSNKQYIRTHPIEISYEEKYSTISISTKGKEYILSADDIFRNVDVVKDNITCISLYLYRKTTISQEHSNIISSYLRLNSWKKNSLKMQIICFEDINEKYIDDVRHFINQCAEYIYGIEFTSESNFPMSSQHNNLIADVIRTIPLKSIGIVGVLSDPDDIINMISMSKMSEIILRVSDSQLCKILSLNPYIRKLKIYNLNKEFDLSDEVADKISNYKHLIDLRLIMRFIDLGLINRFCKVIHKNKDISTIEVRGFSELYDDDDEDENGSYRSSSFARQIAGLDRKFKLSTDIICEGTIIELLSNKNIVELLFTGNQDRYFNYSDLPEKITNAFRSNYSIIATNWDVTNIDDILERNNEINIKSMTEKIFNLYPLINILPPYVVLEIFDHTSPYLNLVSMLIKIDIIIKVKKSCENIYLLRELLQ